MSFYHRFANTNFYFILGQLLQGYEMINCRNKEFHPWVKTAKMSMFGLNMQYVSRKNDAKQNKCRAVNMRVDAQLMK